MFDCRQSDITVFSKDIREEDGDKVKAKSSDYDTAKLIDSSFKSMPEKTEKMTAFTGWINQIFPKAYPHHLKLFGVIILYW